jgi:hypothetical protein
VSTRGAGAVAGAGAMITTGDDNEAGADNVGVSSDDESDSDFVLTHYQNLKQRTLNVAQIAIMQAVRRMEVGNETDTQSSS